MNRILLFFTTITLLLFYNNLRAQISEGGEPASFTFKNSSILNVVLPTISMPEIDIEKLKSEDIINDSKKEIPWRFGENIHTSIDIIKRGKQSFLPDNKKIWRLRIYSQEAQTLNFRFSKYKIPQGAKLFFYNTETNKILGAFTSFNNREDGVFATTLIEGESVVIEYEEPANTAFEGQLIIDNITHGYRNAFEYSKSFGSSGSCNINVGCQEANIMQNQIRSVCMLVVNNNAFCSGALINNTQNDGTPYFLTANHCSTSNNFSSWVFWFNWQSTTCSNPTSAPAHQSVSGCSLKARKYDSDFCLVQLSSAPPSSYQAFYSGWDRSDNVSPNGVCIHHPNGDIKKISFANNPIIAEDYSGFITWRADWSSGVTEPGSSGSPLFDSNHRIIGQLYGGPSACNATPADKRDYYGKFSVSWDDTSSSTRLKDWLDPLNTGQTYANGFDPVQTTDDAQVTQILSPVSFYCSDSAITPQIIIKNKGTNPLTSVIVNYSTTNTGIISQNWTGSLLTEETDTITLADFTISGGPHLFKAFTSNPNNGTDLNLYNDTAYFTFVMKGLQLPFIESFENPSFPPVGWTISNPDNSYTWIRRPAYGIAGNFAACVNLYYYNTPAQVDELTTPAIDLPVSSVHLTFYHSYRRKNTSSNDSLKIYISRDCGTTFDSIPIFSKSGATLATGPDTTIIYTPSAEISWVKHTIPLAQFSESSIKLKFVTVSGLGNNLYIDNIQVNYPANTEIISQKPQIQLFPNPTNGLITFTNTKPVTIQIFNLSGKLIYSEENLQPNAQINLNEFSNGMYFIKIADSDNFFFAKVILNR